MSCRCPADVLPMSCQALAGLPTARISCPSRMGRRLGPGRGWGGVRGSVFRTSCQTLKIMGVPPPCVLFWLVNFCAFEGDQLDLRFYSAGPRGHALAPLHRRRALGHGGRSGDKDLYLALARFSGMENSGADYDNHCVIQWPQVRHRWYPGPAAWFPA